MAKDKNPAKKRAASEPEAGENGGKQEGETVTPPPAAVPQAPAGAPSALWTQFSNICDKHPVASAWAALPYRFEWLLFVMAAAVRFYDLDYPDSVVFDEYHFGTFVGEYANGTYFFDIHPPLGKLSLYWIGSLMGYNASACSYASIHDVYGEGCYYVRMRSIPAFFGSLLPPITFSIAKKMGCSDSIAFLCGAMLVFESMNVIEARNILVDSQLMFYCALALWFALKYWDALERNLASVRNTKQHAYWLLGIAVTCSTALSIKWTTLATPGMIAVECFMALFFIKKPVRFDYLLGVLGVIIALYSFWWWIHFAYLPLSGPEREHRGDEFMPIEFQRKLINNTNYDPDAPQPSFWWILWELNREMYAASARIDSPHHWESKHYQWIGNTRGVLYWAMDDSAVFETREQVYILGNPAVSWLAAAGVAVFLLCNAWRFRYRFELPLTPAQSRLVKSGWFCFFAYAFNLLPYLGVTRQAFCYHYMPALFYAILLFGLLLQWQVGGVSQWALDKLVMPAVLLIVTVTFIHFAPWIYAFPLSTEAHNHRKWLKTWD